MLHLFRPLCDTWHRMKQPRTAVREALLGALLAGSSITDAAKLAKVSRSTAHRIAGEPLFQADLEARLSAKRQPFEAALSEAMGLAVQTLRRLLEAKSETVRLKAASVLLTPRQIATPPSPPPVQPGQPTFTAEDREALGIALKKRIEQQLRWDGWTPPKEGHGPVRTPGPAVAAIQPNRTMGLCTSVGVMEDENNHGSM